MTKKRLTGLACIYLLWACTGCTEQAKTVSTSDSAPTQAFCIVGQDQTCNDNPEFSSLHGICLANQTCKCQEGYALNPETGKCK